MVGAILRRDGRILLCLRSRERRRHPGVWDVPGGHVVDGESERRALVRELEEEIGVRADVPIEPWRTFRTESLEFSLFVVDAWEGDIANRAPHEHEQLRWISLEELPRLQLAHPLYAMVLPQALARP
jgi:8-oxo-dGTP pyrophosphatase MutT (NUDIX family)